MLSILADRNTVAAEADPIELKHFLELRERLRGLALQGMGIAEAARACGISNSYLGRLFRRFDNQTPRDFMVRSRMSFAVSLLVDGKLLVKEVAALAGYDDQYHFSRVFKTIYGHSPEVFRRIRQ